MDKVDFELQVLLQPLGTATPEAGALVKGADRPDKLKWSLH